MKRIAVLTIILLAISLSLNAQNARKYSYDDAGNRTNRKVVTLPATVPLPKAPIEPVRDELGVMKVAIFPNPTKGMLLVRITDCDIDTKNNFTLYNMNGLRLFNGNMQGGGDFPLDMSEYSAGVYILVLVSGKEKTSYKIIKE